MLLASRYVFLSPPGAFARSSHAGCPGELLHKLERSQVIIPKVHYNFIVM